MRITDKILANLNNIGTIDIGNKVEIVDEMIRLDKTPPYLLPIKRMFYGDGRTRTVQFIRHYVELGINYYQIYQQLEEQAQAFNIMLFYNALTNAKKGISNLKVTYNDDNHMQSALNNIINMLEEITACVNQNATC